MPPLLSIVIPALNEESRLPDTLTRVLTFLQGQAYSSEVLVVDNGSTDRTSEIAAGFTASHSNLRLLRDPRSGKGLALQIDATDKEAVYDMVKKVLAAHGQIDILVNNVGGGGEAALVS